VAGSKKTRIHSDANILRDPDAEAADTNGDASARG
jgi:hypothetical protein